MRYDYSDYKVIYIEDKDGKHAYRYDFNDIRNSFKGISKLALIMNSR